MGRERSKSYGPETPVAQRLAWVVIGLGLILIAGAIGVAVTDAVGDGLGDWGPVLVPLAVGLIGVGQVSGGVQILLAGRFPVLTMILPAVRKVVRIGYLAVFVALIVNTFRS